MIDAIGQILGFAFGVAISPIPIIAVILMLFSSRAASNSLAFSLGWLAGLSVVCTVVLALGIGGADDEDVGGWLQVVIGALFLALAIRQWRSRLGPADEPEMPGWMAAIDELAAPKAFGLGFLLSAPNPKNLGLSIAAASTIGAAELAGRDEVVVVVVYVLLASVTILVPVVGYLLARSTMTPVLDDAKTWLTANNATVMAVLFVVLGAKVLGSGVAGVAS